MLALRAASDFYGYPFLIRRTFVLFSLPLLLSPLLSFSLGFRLVTSFHSRASPFNCILELLLLFEGVLLPLLHHCTTATTTIHSCSLNCSLSFTADGFWLACSPSELLRTFIHLCSMQSQLNFSISLSGVGTKTAMILFCFVIVLQGYLTKTGLSPFAIFRATSFRGGWTALVRKYLPIGVFYLYRDVS